MAQPPAIGPRISRRRVLQMGVVAGAGAALFPGMAARAGGSGQPGAPTDLTVDGLPAPVGVGLDDVFFAWRVADGRRGAAQRAYRLVVSGAGSAVVWDSGVVASAQQAFVAYTGPALQPDATYQWTVQTWDGAGNPGPPASPATFSTGLSDGDWRAEWIKRDTVEPPPNNSTTFEVQDGLGVWLPEDEFSYVRTEAELRRSPIVRALAYVSADQLYELYVNGRMVGKGLAYQFPDSQYYETWDVTEDLRAGAANAFGILYNWQGPAKGHPAGTPGVIAHISVLHADGAKEVLATDGTWRVLPGAWLPGTQRDEEGDPVDYTENIDGPAIPVGWDLPGYDDVAWLPATVIGAHPTAPWTHLVSVRTRMAFEPVTAVSLTTVGGSVVADFGKIYAALPQVTFRAGVPGRLVPMHAGDLLDPSGRVSITHGTQHTDMSYSYVQRGGVETFRSFDYLGFRYLQIDDAGEQFSPGDVVALTKHVAVPDEHAGTFLSSDATVDAVFELGRHSALFCMQEQFVDTPTREQGSWLWDGHNESMTAIAAFGDQNQTRKSLVEFGQSQARYWPDGPVNKIYPTALGGQQIAYSTAIYAEWVWNYWVRTGDRPLLAHLYPVVENVAGFIERYVVPSTGIITNIPTATDVTLYPVDALMNFLGVNVFRRVAAMADALGRPPAEAALQRQRQAALIAGIDRYLSRPDGLYADGLQGDGTQVPTSSQTTNAYALVFGVVPTGRVERVMTAIIDAGMATPPSYAGDMLEALRLTGQDQAMLRLLTDRSQPGWANILAQGGTFCWEVWDPTDTDLPVDPIASFFPGNSMSHGWGSNVLVAIQQTMLGVAPTAPGFSTFAVAPPLHALQHAAGQVPTPAGPITVAWARGAGTFSLDVDVPPNTSAVIGVPAPSPAGVTESGQAVDRAPGVRAVAQAGEYVAVTVGAGSYAFRAGSTG
jgi:alpha-L-rhamnosidase